MKIGILTFHHVHNYGAVLQAFALKIVLENMGHLVEIINYRNPAVEDRIKPFMIKKFRKDPLKYLGRLLNIGYSYCMQVRHFNSFLKEYLNVTAKNYTPNDIQQSDYDALVIGSDQLWNPMITDGPDPVFWGANKPDGALQITYAVSSGDVATLETRGYEHVKDWLARFDAISVREERLKRYVELHSDITAQVVLDPTLLIGREFFEQLSSTRIIQEPYVLLYRVEGSANLTAITKKVAELYHAKIIRVGPSPLKNKLKDGKNGIRGFNASIEELLSLIKYAECVVALSFHGTVLSLLFEKDFYSIRGKNMARVEEILTKCYLKDRIVETVDDVVKTAIDYSNVKKILTDLRQSSFKWLENVLSTSRS